MEVEWGSISHNALSSNRYRDLGTRHLFILRVIRGKNDVNVVAIAFLGQRDGAAHFFSRDGSHLAALFFRLRPAGI